MRIRAEGHLVDQNKADLRWGVEQRLEFIEFRLFWEGHVNRSDVMDQFSLSVNQATADLSRYSALAPKNMIYDKSARSYVRGPGFKSVFGKLDAGRYLAQLRLLKDQLIDPDDCWIAELPAFDTTSVPLRGIHPETLRAVASAIRRQEPLEVNYQSLSHPEPRWRLISPHALAFDGFRWHARAFCHAGSCFKDFLISRMLEVREAAETAIPAVQDDDWHTEVRLEIAPHPALSETQAKVISLDYGMQNGKAEIKVRRALLYSTLRRLGLDTDPYARKPQDQQIVLLNADEISHGKLLPATDGRNA